MKQPSIKPKVILTLFLTLGLSFGLSACSNTEKAKPKYKTIQTLNEQQKVETGTIVSVRNINIEPRHHSRPSIGVAASSGGFRGIYGSIDVGTLSRIFGNNKTTEAQEIIVKKTSGDTIAITQVSKEKFKQGETVKILLRNGKSIVVR